MKNRLFKNFVLFLVGMFLVGCGTSKEQLAAQTAIAATGTFEALPTATLTFTLTPTSTITPTATMTFTPTMTSTPTITPSATSGRIEGRVFLTDVDKTIIPLSAQITLNSVKIETDAQGYYSFPELEPGQYAMRVLVVISVVDLPLKYGRGIYDVALTRLKNPGEGDITNTGTLNLADAVRLVFPYNEFSVEAGDVLQMDIELSLLGRISWETPTPTPTP